MTRPSFTTGTIESASIAAILATIGVGLYLIGNAIRTTKERERHEQAISR